MQFDGNLKIFKYVKLYVARVNIDPTFLDIKSAWKSQRSRQY